MKNLLEVLNSMEISDYSLSCGETEYVLVKNNEKNVMALLEAGLTLEELEKYTDGDAIDISMIAWEYTEANCWSKSKGFYFNELVELRDL